MLVRVSTTLCPRATVSSFLVSPTRAMGSKRWPGSRPANCFSSTAVFASMGTRLYQSKRRRNRKDTPSTNHENECHHWNEAEHSDSHTEYDGGDASTTGPTTPELNRRQRMQAILQRDGFECVWCQSPLANEATTDHVIPRIKGGPSWMENEVAACRRCNHLRGNARPTDFLAYCRDVKGWQPHRQAIVDALHALDAAIQQRGGQRKARPYLASELKRIQKL